jgi:hypothetical protein
MKEKYQLAIGSMLITIGIIAIISNIFIFHGFPIGDSVTIERGNTKYIGSYEFSYYKDGIVSVSYVVGGMSYSSDQPSQWYVDPFNYTYPIVNKGTEFSWRSYGFHSETDFTFTTVEITQNYIVLKRTL